MGCGLYSRRTFDPGVGTGLAEQAGAGSGARVVSTGVSPGQVLPGLQTPRLGGLLGPSGSSRLPLSCRLYHMLMYAAGLDCRWAGGRPGPGTGAGRDRLSPRLYGTQGRGSLHIRLSTVSFPILSRSNGGRLDLMTPACRVTVGGGRVGTLGSRWMRLSCPVSRLGETAVGTQGSEFFFL